MRFSLIIWSVLIGLGIPTNLLGQNLRFESISDDSGLTNSTINCIYQDYRGFLWFGTWSGLFQYDGYQIRSFYTRNSQKNNGLSSNKITSIFEDANQTLWIGTRNGGLFQYDREQEFFNGFKNDSTTSNSLCNNSVWAITEDKEGWLWIGTEGGLSLLSPARDSFINFYQAPTDLHQLQSDFIYDLNIDAEDRVWIGTAAGLYQCIIHHEKEKSSFKRISLNEQNLEIIHPFDDFVYRVKPSKFNSNVLWLGTKGGLKKISIQDEAIIKNYKHEKGNSKSLSNNFVSDILELKTNSNTQIWIGTFQGLNVLEPETEEIKSYFSDEQDSKSINNNTIQSLNLGENDNIWIGSNRGVNILSQAKNLFKDVPISFPRNNKEITSISSNHNDSIIIVGSRGDGISVINRWSNGDFESNSKPKRFRNIKFEALTEFVSSLKRDANGKLWIATHGGGLLMMDEQELRTNQPEVQKYSQFTHTENQASIGDNYIMSLFPSNSGNIWIGLWNEGLNLFLVKENRFIRYRNLKGLNLTDYPIVSLYEQDSILWAGTRGGGCLKLRIASDSHKLELIHKYEFDEESKTSISNNFINSFAEDSLGNLWIATENGLNYLNISTGEFTAFFKEDGLPSNIIQALLFVNSSSFWASTQEGLAQLNLEKDSISIKNYYKSDGLQDNFFNSDAGLKMNNGQLLFGGVNGLNAFFPNEIKEDSIPPKVAITDFRIFNKSVKIGDKINGRIILETHISEAKSINLTHKENFLSLAFTGLHFAQPQKIKYAYKLEGFNDNWIYTNANERVANFTNLPYKTFTFKVKAANNDGIWSKEEAKIIIKISPPFWLSNWAFLLYAVLIIGILIVIRQITLMRFHLKNKLALEQLEREKLEEIDKVKTQFFTNVSHELRTPLTLIISPLEDLIKEKLGDKTLRDTFNRMYKNGHRLLTMINQLLDLRKNEAGHFKLKLAKGDFGIFIDEIALSFKGLANQKNIQLILNKADTKLIVWYDADQMEKVIFNLITNAIKFTPKGGSINITYGKSANNKAVFVSVKDNGVGLDDKDLPYIFDRFYQTDNTESKTRTYGWGVGLALSKTIVEAHKGDIFVERNSVNGTTFTVSLLLGEEHFDLGERAVVEVNKENASVKFQKANFIQKESSSQPLANPFPDIEEKHKLLIVEDNEDIHEYLKTNLNQYYEILSAYHGVEGLKIAKAELPDLIVSDIAMPFMDGIDLCKEIKTHIETSHIPVILLTARTSLIFKIDGLETGADDYVTKPFNMRLLATRIKNLIESRIKLREKFAGNIGLDVASSGMNSLDKKFLTQLKKIIQSHIDDSNFSVEQLADEMSVSRMQLYRKTKALMGNSPNKIILKLRLNWAAKLISSGQYNVSEITYMVGYNDLKSFREQFKKEFGVSPSAYLK